MAISLLLCVFTAAMWLRSYVRSDRLGGLRVGGKLDIVSLAGRVQIAYAPGSPADLDWSHRGWSSRPVTVPEFDVRYDKLALGIGYAAHPIRFPATPTEPALSFTNYVLVLPYWLLLLAAALVPAWAVARMRRRRIRSAQWRCLSCGYDLRASADRCPECGAVPERAQGAAA